MAAGNRNKTGKPTDIVRHYKTNEDVALCGRKSCGYSSDDLTDVTCKTCLKKLGNTQKTLPQEIIQLLESSLIFNKFGIVNLKILKSSVQTSLTDIELKELINAKYASEMVGGAIEYL